MMQRKALNRSDLIGAYTSVIRDRLLESLVVQSNHIPLELRVNSTNTILSFYRVEGGEFWVYIWVGTVIRWQQVMFLSEIEDGSGLKRALVRFMDLQNREGLRELSCMVESGVIE